MNVGEREEMGVNSHQMSIVWCLTRILWPMESMTKIDDEMGDEMADRSDDEMDN